MKRYLQAFWKEEQGQDLVEYALLAALVSLAAVVALPVMGTTINSVFTKITSYLTASGV